MSPSVVEAQENPLEWAYSQSGLPQTTKFVLVTLAKHASWRDFTCYPSIERLCELCSLKIRAVKYAIADLLHCGYITITGWKFGKVPIYKLAVGLAVRWLGSRRSKKPQTHDAPRALFDAPSAPEACTTCINPVHQVHPNNSSPEREYEQERERDAAASPAAEFQKIKIGSRYSVTASQCALLEDRFGDQFKQVVSEISAYGETRPIEDFFALGMRWRIRQPERRKYDRHSPERRDAEQRTFDENTLDLIEVLESPGGHNPYGWVGNLHKLDFGELRDFARQRRAVSPARTTGIRDGALSTGVRFLPERR